MQDLKTFLKNAAHVVPSKRQLDWFNMEFYGFVHFTVNAFTNLEWGLGNEDPAIFNPVDLDADQWVEAFKSAGMKSMVLTAKHHDGFCLWPSKYTEHSIKNSPYKNGKGDIVKEAAEACRRGGIKFGFYLSPWDRNSPYYGTDEYNEYYKNQLRELLTNYGEIFYIWFDGACGEGPNGKKQVYDFDGYVKLIRELQPNAAIFGGPDVRWCGNESGTSRNSEWAVVPCELFPMAERQTEGALIDGDVKHISAMDEEIGSLASVMYSKGLAFAGAEVDMSIRKGWFYHPEEEPHSLERLFDTYLRSVGGNCCFHLNVPPMPNGRFNDADVKRLAELGEKIRNSFAEDLAEGKELKLIERRSDTQSTYIIDLGKECEIDCIEISEDIAQGQRVEIFQVYKRNHFGEWGESICQGTTIGHKRICMLRGSYNVSELVLDIQSARDEAIIKSFKVYNTKAHTDEK